MERLAIPVLSPSTLISRALLPEFLSLEEAVQKSVLDYVVRHWDGLEQNELTVALAAAPFVTTGQTHHSPLCCQGDPCFRHTLFWSLQCGISVFWSALP